MTDSGAATRAALEERRAFECRLTPDRALGTLEEAAGFVGDRGLVTRTPDCSLPSLFEACHEEPYRAGGHGFAAWPKTKYSWAGELGERPDVHVLKIHLGKNIFLTPATIALADPVCRAELARMEAADPGWKRLLRYLAEAGPALLDTVQQELGLTPKELKAIRTPLERCGALVARQVVEPAADGGGHLHSSEIARFDQVFPEPPAPAPAGPEEGLARLVVAGVRAAVLAPEKEIRRWFSWKWLFGADLLDRLVAEGALARPAPGLVTTGPRTDLTGLGT